MVAELRPSADSAERGPSSLRDLGFWAPQAGQKGSGVGRYQQGRPKRCTRPPGLTWTRLGACFLRLALSLVAPCLSSSSQSSG